MPYERRAKRLLDQRTGTRQGGVDRVSITAFEGKLHTCIGLIIVQPIAKAEPKITEFNTGLAAGASDREAGCSVGERE
jgi:hypothetical protein